MVFLIDLHKNLVCAEAPEHITQQWLFNYIILRYSKLAILTPADVFESAAKRIPFEYLNAIIVVPSLIILLFLILFIYN